MNNSVIVNSYKTVPETVECFVTTRHGGYSKGKYGNMNLAVSTDEDHRVGMKNIELLKSTFNLKTLVNLNQVHGNRVYEVTSDNYHDVMYSEGDGLFTVEKDIALGVLTADCYNVFMAGRKGVAALHCGHKSVSSDIMSEAIRMFERHDDFPVFAGIGPGISCENYEIGPELADVFGKICHDSIVVKDGKMFLSIRTVIEQNLTKAGIRNIEHIRNCTYADSDLYSHRRDKGVTGRMMGVIVRRGDVL